MSNRTKLLAAALALLATFAAGRYSVKSPPAVAITEKKQKDVVTHEDKHEDIKTVTVIEKEPSGATKTVITQERVKTNEITQVKKTVTDIKEVVSPVARKATNISLIAATKISDLRPEYGISVTREIVGPVTVGVFGLSGGTIGLSVGLDF